MNKSSHDRIRGSAQVNADGQREDLIDFPCSPLWLDHYADLGLTPRRSTAERPPCFSTKHPRYAQQRHLADPDRLERLLALLEHLVHKLRTVDASLRGEKRGAQSEGHNGYGDSRVRRSSGKAGG